MELRFSIAQHDLDAALAWLAGQGFVPCRVEQGEGDAALVFAPMAEDRMRALAMALPVHLGSKVGIVVGDRPPFTARRRI